MTGVQTCALPIFRPRHTVCMSDDGVSKLVPASPDLSAVLDRFAPKWYRGVDVGPGWFGIVVDLDEALARVDPDYQIMQVKSKFGGLCFYFAPSESVPEPQRAAVRERMNELVAAAERRAARTCEYSGAPGTLMIRDGFYATVSDEVAAANGFSPLPEYDDD